jgi:hypothetical protein
MTDDPLKDIAFYLSILAEKALEGESYDSPLRKRFVDYETGCPHAHDADPTIMSDTQADLARKARQHPPVTDDRIQIFDPELRAYVECDRNTFKKILNEE